MGFTIYFQCTKYQTNHFDTFSAMLYFILPFYPQLIYSPRYVCGDIYMERSTYARCHGFPPNSDSTLETDGEKKGGEKMKRERGWGEVFDLFQRYYKLSEYSFSLSFSFFISFSLSIYLSIYLPGIYLSPLCLPNVSHALSHSVPSCFCLSQFISLV